MSYPPCTEKCRAQVDCKSCGKRKAPIGRSIPLGCDYCNSVECDDYRADPYPPHLWPGECLECATRMFDGIRGECEVCRRRDDDDAAGGEGKR